MEKRIYCNKDGYSIGRSGKIICCKLNNMSVDYDFQPKISKIFKWFIDDYDDRKNIELFIQHYNMPKEKVKKIIIFIINGL